MGKNILRKKYIADHGRSCTTCNSEPTNHGQRDSCQLEDFCNEENEYPHYREALQIYSIDIKHSC